MFLSLNKLKRLSDKDVLDLLNVTPFPYKYTFIEDSPKSIFKSIVKLNRKWDNSKYTTSDSDIITPNVYESNADMYPITFKSKYYTFKCEKGDYEKYDIITDLFTEESRIKSYRPSRTNVSPYTAWYSKSDRYGYKLDVVKRMRKLNRDVTIGDLRELCYGSRLVSEVAHEKVIFLKSLIELISDKKDLRIFDACAGWGDRLIASIAVGAEQYLGVEPNKDTDFNNIIKTLGREGNYKVLHDSMPNAKIGDKNFDLCFLSPPSFSSENYGTSEGQSVVMFPNRTDWLFGFLFPTIDKCWNLLTDGGILVVQSIIIPEISNYITYKFNNCRYLGVVSVECSSGRKKCMWMWMKDKTYKNKKKAKALSRFNYIIQQMLKGEKPYAILTSKMFSEYPNALVWNEDNDYSKYSKVIIFKAHDYFYDIKRFISELEEIGDKLINPLPIVKWNYKKTYLRDLKEYGLSFAPDVVYSTNLTLNDFSSIKTKEIIIKPVIGGNSYNVIRAKKPRNEKEVDSIKETMYKDLKYPYEEGEEFIVQQLYKTEGEISCVFFNGEYSHSIIKQGKEIFNYNINRRMLNKCKEVLKAIEDITLHKPMYCRIDFINDDILLEVELIEPNLHTDNDLQTLLEELQ